MGTEKLETEVRQEQILQAALTLIANHGTEGLSIGAVARRIGLVPSAIYRHFESKDEIIEAVLDLIGERLLENVKAVGGEIWDSVERLRQVLLRHVKLIRENEGILRIVFSESLYTGKPERKAKVYEVIRRYLREVEELIKEGQKAGLIRSDVVPATLALMFLGLIQPAAFIWHLSDGKFDVTKQVERAWQIFQEFIMAK